MPQWQERGQERWPCIAPVAFAAKKQVPGCWISGLEVYELDGGIMNYFLTLPDADREWQGECFVFDNRVAIDTHLKETDTPVEAVYKDEPDAEWRINRARRLAAS